MVSKGETVQMKLMEMTSPLAKEIAEHTLLQRDIKASFEGMKLWFKDYAGRNDLSPEEHLIAGGLFRDAILMFMGCFDPTAPLKLKKEDVYKEENGSLAFFQWMLDLRDTYAAHKFGPYRQCVVGLFMDDKGQVQGIGELNNIYCGPLAEGRDSMMFFISEAGRYVDQVGSALLERLKEEAHAMSPEELAKLKPARLRGVDPEHARMSRKAFHRMASKLPTNDPSDTTA